jgi:cysteinyl-tRNA synthetase
MKLFNTLTKKLDEVKPLDGTTIRIYSCGPTVYDHIHIGNLSSFIFADTLHRVTAQNGQKITHVMNFTDVDDKTIRRALESKTSDDPKEALKTLTKKYEAIFVHDMQAIGNDTESVTFVRATESIPAMQELIVKLHDGGFAYVTDDGVYFSIAKYRAAGKTYGQLLEITASSTSEARIDNDEYDKDSAHDFALWKLKKDNEPAWEFSLDGTQLDGRPGWHIECSAMSATSLSQPFDIHTGGIDLIFPHHENEIAQSTALTENPIMVTIFAHNEHVLIDGKKMSKSLQNFYTLEDLAKKGFEPLAFRLLMLQSHYRSQTNFTWESLDAAQNRLNELRAWADLRHQPSTDTMPEELNELFKTTRESMKEAVESDLNTPMAFAALSKLVGYMQTVPIPGVEGKHMDGILKFIDDIFGLELSNRPDITDEQKTLIKQREDARAAKDFAASDRLRLALEEQAITVRDTPNGTIWTRQWTQA